MASHGTQRCYDEGCGCDLCTARNTERSRAKRARRAAGKRPGQTTATTAARTPQQPAREPARVSAPAPRPAPHRPVQAPGRNTPATASTAPQQDRTPSPPPGLTGRARAAWQASQESLRDATAPAPDPPPPSGATTVPVQAGRHVDQLTARRAGDTIRITRQSDGPAPPGHGGVLYDRGRGQYRRPADAGGTPAPGYPGQAPEPGEQPGGWRQAAGAILRHLGRLAEDYQAGQTVTGRWQDSGES
jgi:hypothetical protein